MILLNTESVPRDIHVKSAPITSKNAHALKML